MNTTKTPATVREAGDMAHAKGMTLSEFLDSMPPIPTPPAGYVLAEGCSDHWIGTETINGGWFITPAWNSTTGAHSLELWVAEHQPPSYANLTPDEALQLAADLTAAAQAIRNAE
ncbi:hypothetical protein [Arthrobacter sp. AL12]|uniref:hypothetical protein n=1 Tax=Arthrobacter sp. AL12 TaxID=3042241 RepID=UPI00249A1995|nr:hypothetical protein [Arthrobacter sp. AL12]MDI3211692.1 hypothetical protein [Arthrobacter sp. AL12]